MKLGVLEDDRCLDVSDLRLSRECPHCYVAKVVRITYRDMNEEVVVPGHVEEGNDFGQFTRVGTERLDL